ncbi:FAD-dependent oxidoreductase [Patescibacteria group bacterium]|nr:FAD-dependent oxidoreductase [Patescibacteria group bacterium]
MNYLILGGGIAGTTLAEELRKGDGEASITILERETHPLYSKVLLMNYVKGKVSRDKLFLKKLEWYSENRIELALGVEAREIDCKNQFVLASDGREYPYDKLIIATGMQPRLAGENIRGIAYFRNLDDAEELKELIAQTLASDYFDKNCVVVGGGFISTEFIDIFNHFNLPTSVCVRSEGFWSKVLSTESQLILQNHLENAGVKIFSKSNIEFNEMNGYLDSVNVSKGVKVSAQIAGMGIGLVAENEIFTKAGINCKIGVVVDEYMQSETENVYAIGDIAEYNDIALGRKMVSGNWLGALMQARSVAKTLLGEATAYNLVTAYTTDLLGKAVVFIGDVSKEHADDVVQLNASKKDIIEVFQRDNKTVGAVMIGDVSRRQEITDAIINKKLYS